MTVIIKRRQRRVRQSKHTTGQHVSIPTVMLRRIKRIATRDYGGNVSAVISDMLEMALMQIDEKPIDTTITGEET